MGRDSLSWSRGRARLWFFSGSVASCVSLFVGLLGAVVVQASRRPSRAPAMRRDAVAHAARTPSPVQGAMGRSCRWVVAWIARPAVIGAICSMCRRRGPRDDLGQQRGQVEQARAPLRWIRGYRGWWWRRRARVGRSGRDRACCRPRRARSDRGRWTRARTRGRGQTRHRGAAVARRAGSRRPPRTPATRVSPATLTALASSRTRRRGIAVRVVRIMPVPYSSEIARTASTAMTAWPRSTPREREFGGVLAATDARGLVGGERQRARLTPMVRATAPMSSQAVR